VTGVQTCALPIYNELIIEFNYEKVSKRGKDRRDTEDPVSREEQELLSEMKKRRLEDGTLQIFKSEFVVEGLLRKIVNVKQGDGKNSEQTEDEEE
jgi:hypothetical protein